MPDGFIEISDTGSLESFLKQSRAPVVIFKHSKTCGISDRAYSELSRLLAENRLSGTPVGLVVVQKARDVSDQIEASTGVAHESPQVLIMVGGKVVWSASHLSVKAPAIEAALRSAKPHDGASRMPEP